MDSSNLSGIQTIPFNCKNTASNTIPMACDCCGLKNCGQIFPPAQCFRALPTGIPYGKPSQESFEDKFAMHQPFFQGFPFPSPFYYSLIPQNSCYFNNPLNDREKSQRQSSSDFDKTRESEEQNFCRKEKTFKNQIPTSGEPAHKNNNSRPDFQCSGNPFYFPHSPESQINFLLHRCSCGDSLPWACTPFLVPVISYCVSWNSHKFNRGITGVTSAQNTNQTNKDNPETEKSSSSNIGFCNSIQVHSREFKEASLKQLENYNKEGENIRDDIGVYTKEGASVNETASQIRSECPANNKVCCTKSISDVSTEVSGLSKNHSEVDLKENCTSRLESRMQSRADLKEADNTSGVGILYSASEVNPSDLSTEEKDSTEDLVQISSDVTVTETNEITSKKCIKNFTMTDQNNETHYEAPQVFSAAAGDLGGEDCVGYKINIQTIEENETENALQETRTEEKVHAPEIFYQALEDVEKNKSSRIPQKYLEENPSPTQNVKSGSAKLATPQKIKNTKENVIKTIKRPTNQESSGLRRRHNCLSFEKTEKTPSEQNSKTQKTKITGLQQPCTEKHRNQQQNQGASRQQRMINDRSPKKDEKSLKVKVQTTNVSQKVTKWTNKNTPK